MRLCINRVRKPSSVWLVVITSIRVISDCRFTFLMNLIAFHPFKMSYTTGDEITVEPYEEVIGNPHYNSLVSSRSSSP